MFVVPPLHKTKGIHFFLKLKIKWSFIPLSLSRWSLSPGPELVNFKYTLLKSKVHKKDSNFRIFMRGELILNSYFYLHFSKLFIIAWCAASTRKFYSRLPCILINWHTASTFKFQFSAKNRTRFLVLKFTESLCTNNILYVLGISWKRYPHTLHTCVHKESIDSLHWTSVRSPSTLLEGLSMGINY